jgi:hypothetical protein
LLRQLLRLPLQSRLAPAVPRLSLLQRSMRFLCLLLCRRCTARLRSRQRFVRLSQLALEGIPLHACRFQLGRQRLCLALGLCRHQRRTLSICSARPQLALSLLQLKLHLHELLVQPH